MIGRPLTDLTGRMYGRLTVLHREGSDRSCMPLWRCRCVCDATVRVRGNSLKQGLTRSCGCLRSEVSSGLMREIWRRRAA